MTDSVFAVDLGATWLRTAVVGPDGLRPRAKSVQPTPASAADTRALVDSEWHRAGSPRSVAVAAAPELTADGIVRRWPNRRDFEGANLLSEAIRKSAEIAILDDATAAAISAHPFDRQDETTICLSVGTGIGGGAVITGFPLTGRSGAAMDIGHIPVPSASGLLCSCGRYGCLQAAASGKGVRNLLVPPRPVSDIFQEEGSDVAPALARASAAIVEALGILDRLFDPDRVLVAGGFGLSQLFDHVEDALKSRQIAVPIERHPLGEDAGLIGAVIGHGLRRCSDPRAGRP